MKNYLTLILYFFIFSSCSDFLTREPVEQISINTQLSTKKGILEALNGVYYKVRENQLGTSAFTYGDLLSGNLSFSPNPSINKGIIDAPVSVDKIYDFNDDKLDSDMSSLYAGSYEMINNINLILEYVDTLKDANESEKNQIKAEALSLRAFVHFYLTKVFAQNYTYTSDASHLGIVYNTRTLKVGIDYPVRKTLKENYDQLQLDINTAISLYQSSPAIPVGQPKKFFSKNAAKTLAAEIALYKNDWQTAYNLSNEVIRQSGISLSPKSTYPTTWAVEETIFEIAPTNENSSYLDRMYNYSTSTSYSDFVMSYDLYNQFESNDLRRNLYEIINLSTKVGNGFQNLPYVFTKKYKTGVAGLIYRLSELYFIRAESAFKLGNTAQALSDINTIRNRAGLNSLTSVTLDDILLEKRKEFAFENKYFFDMMRNHKNIVRILGCISNNCNPSYPSDKFVAPIPQNSIELNSNMQQNPSY